MSDTTKGIPKRKKEVTLTGIFGEHALNELLKKLVDAIGISFFIIDYKGQIVTERMIHDDYCKKRHHKARECQECTLVSAFAAAKAAIKCTPVLFRCPDDLVSMALPIIVNDQYLGAVIGGRIRCPQSDSFSLLSDYEKTEELQNDADLYKAIPSMSDDKISAISELVFTLLKEMGDKETYELHVVSAERQEIHLQDIRKKNVQLQKDLEEAQQNNRKPKILPQFLISLFVTVSNFAILEKAEKTENVISDLSEILRYYVDNQQDMVPVKHELEQMELLLKTLKAQYGERFHYEIHCDESAQWKLIPTLCLFPYVQNLINTKMLPAGFKGDFLIETESIGNRLVITMQLQNFHFQQDRSPHKIRKNAVSMTDEDTITEQMADTQKRLQYIYGDTYSISVQPDMVTMDIPESGTKERSLS